MFDAQSFINSTLTDANSTRLKPAPVGEYTGVIQPIDSNSFASGDKDGKPWARMNVLVEVTGDPRIKEALGLDTKVIRGSIMLDVTPAGTLDMGEGRNISLGRLREATGLNVPGQPFSPTMLGGKVVKIVVAHRPDKNDPELVYEDIKAFLPLA